MQKPNDEERLIRTRAVDIAIQSGALSRRRGRTALERREMTLRQKRIMDQCRKLAAAELARAKKEKQ